MEIRVIKIPAMKMVSSGPLTDEKTFFAFDNWWSGIDVKNYITPRDFMQFNKQQNCMEQLFAIPEEFVNTSKYEIIDFPGGLYAVATAKDKDDEFKRVRQEILEWVENNEHFTLPDNENDISERYELTHVITPKIFKEKCGYHLSDCWIPIVVNKVVE
jgi:DNA gyrase inhibitor GyrI